MIIERRPEGGTSVERPAAPHADGTLGARSLILGATDTVWRLLASPTSLAMLALAALNVFIFNGVYFAGMSFPADFAVTYYPLNAYWIASVTAGEWPSWVPYIAMGYPFAAQPQSGAFYLPFWVFPVLHLPFSLTAASVMQALHVLAGGVGAYVLARRIFHSTPIAFVAGSAFLAYGGFYSNAEHADIVRSFALMPWFLWAILLESDSIRSTRLRISKWYVSGLTLPNLALPVVTYLLVTGGYPGCTISILFVSVLFVLVQAALNVRRGQSLLAAILDLVILGVLVGLGLSLAADFLVPLISLSSELLRANTYASQDRLFLQLTDLYELVIPSAFLRWKDHSMFGMQLPLVLAPFLAFLRLSTWRRLLPFVAVAVAACLMCIDVFSAVPGALAHLAPYLGYSRFPSGDYRTLIALPLLLLMCGGLSDALVLARRAPRSACIRYAAALALVIALALPVLIALNPNDLAQPLGVFVFQILAAAIACAVLMGSSHSRVANRLTIVVCALALLSMAPVLIAMAGLWQLPLPEKYREAATGIALWQDGELNTDRIFRQHYAARPPRTPGEDPLQVYWSGYIAGNFTMGDNGSVALAARENLKLRSISTTDQQTEGIGRLIQANPALLQPEYQRLLIQSRGWVFFEGEPHGADGLPDSSLISSSAAGPLNSNVDLSSFMQQGSTLAAIRCPDRSCGSLDVAHLSVDGATALAAPDFIWEPIRFGRSSIDYHVTLAEPALVIENELFSSGWRGSINGAENTQLSPVRVDGSVRGWNLPAGDYDFSVSYSTPLLGVGLALSALALLAYIIVGVTGLVVFRPRRVASIAWPVTPVGNGNVAAATRRRSIAAFRTLATALLVNAVVIWVYFWFATGGKYEFRGDGGYYGWLTEAFLAGQTYLKIDPPPELLNLPDPYDPVQHIKVNHPVPDGSLYKGHYYMYWGPVPALLHAAWQIETRQSMQSNMIMFWFGFGAVVMLWALLRELRDETFPRVSDWALNTVFVCATIGGVGLYLQARPIIHHEAITSATLFVIAGAYFWLRALRSSGTGWLNLVASGTCFGLAEGSRTTEVVYVIGIGLVLLAGLRTRGMRWISIQRLLAFGIPVSILTGLLLVYNYIRFDTPFEFGTKYVLTGLQDLYHNPLGVFDFRAIPDNILAYVTYVPTFSPYFPWVVTNYSFVPPVKSGLGYAVEPPFASALLVAPLILLLPVTVFWAVRRWRTLSLATRQFVASIAIGLVGALWFVLFTNFASGRYLEEVLPLGCVLAGLGFFALISRFPRRRALMVMLGTALVAISALGGGLMGIWELGLFPDAFQGLAYPIDSAEAALIRRVDDRQWPATYLDELPRRRPWGVFYPDGAVVRFSITSRGMAKALNMWSLFTHSTTVRIVANGTPLGDYKIDPGQVNIQFKQRIAADPYGHVDLQLEFPDEHASPPLLWPVTLWSLGEAT